MKHVNRVAIPGIVLVVAMAGLFSLSVQGQSKDKLEKPTEAKKLDHLQHGKHLEECAKACSDCQRACDTCQTHCAHMLHAGEKAHMTTLMSCADCATVCASASEILSRGGPFSSLICVSCAEACQRCAVECEKFKDDMHMKKCAEECRKCEKACREMVKPILDKPVEKV